MLLALATTTQRALEGSRHIVPGLLSLLALAQSGFDGGSMKTQVVPEVELGQPGAKPLPGLSI